jgi:type IV pilus assembly protein PilV
MPVRSDQIGFTLIEGLISLLILTVGLLGAAYMQVYVHTTTAQTSYRALATSLGSELVSQVMADPQNAGCYILNSEAPPNINGRSSVCNSAAATAFMTAWNAQLAKLPGAGNANQSSVTIDATGLTTITLQWDLARDSARANFNVPHRYILITQVS